MRWRLAVAVVHTAEWRCVGPVATARRSDVVEWYISLSVRCRFLIGRSVIEW